MPTETCTKENGEEKRGLVAVTTQGSLNRAFVGFVSRGGTTQIAATLLGQTGCQVAGSSPAMHRFARGRQAKTLFGGLVGLHLGLGFGF